MKKDKIFIYSDGAARGNPGPAGWGAVISFSGKEIKLGGHFDFATNNQMELTACLEALKYLKNKKIKKSIEIFSDSKYVINGIQEWIFNWQKNNWQTANRKPVLNMELWQQLFLLTQDFEIIWHYVPGHSGVLGNEKADQIATSWADFQKK